MSIVALLAGSDKKGQAERARAKADLCMSTGALLFLLKIHSRSITMQYYNSINWLPEDLIKCVWKRYVIDHVLTKLSYFPKGPAFWKKIATIAYLKEDDDGKFKGNDINWSDSFCVRELGMDGRTLRANEREEQPSFLCTPIYWDITKKVVAGRN